MLLKVELTDRNDDVLAGADLKGEGVQLAGESVLLLAEAGHGLDAVVAVPGGPARLQQQLDGGEHAALEGDDVIEFIAPQAAFAVNGIHQAALLDQIGRASCRERV